MLAKHLAAVLILLGWMLHLGVGVLVAINTPSAECSHRRIPSPLETSHLCEFEEITVHTNARFLALNIHHRCDT